MLMRSFTKREKILLLFLSLVLIAGFYLLAVHYPVKTRLEEIELEKIEVADQTEAAIAAAQRYLLMKNELDEIFALPEDEITVMPPYDNEQTLALYFHDVFKGTAPNLIFGSVKTEGNVAQRTISFSFTADSYESAKTILRQLTATGFRCQLQNLTLSPANGDIESDEIRVSGNIVFYELIS